MQLNKTVMIYKESNSKYYKERLKIHSKSGGKFNLSLKGDVVLRDVDPTLFRTV